MKKRSFFPLILFVLSSLCACKEEVANTNPLLSTWETPYGVPPFDKIHAEDFRPAIDQGISEHNRQIDSIVRNAEIPSFQNVILPLEESGETLRRTYTLFSLLKSADSNDSLQQLALELTPLVAAHNDGIYLNERLFDRVNAVYQQSRMDSFPEQQQRLTEKLYRRFVRAGALLTPEQKSALKEINQQLSTLSVTFGNHLLAANHAFVLSLTEKDLTGLPEGVKTAAQQEAIQRKINGRWVFTLSKPSLIPFLTYSTREDLRERLYTAYVERCNDGEQFDNKKVVNDIVRLRLEKAKLLGFDSYGAFALDETMARTPERVYSLLDKLWTPALQLAKTELEEMKRIKKEQTGKETFAPWDWWYYAEKVRKERYALDEEMLRPFLSLDHVVQGAFMLSNRLWGITFRPVSLPVYNADCVTYEVLDKGGKQLGILYLDFFPRPGKEGGAWCGAYREACYEQGDRIAPIVTIVTNFTPPSPNSSTPALLNLDETETFFHEFGHALHSLFSQVRYRTLGEVEQDFVELPSQIMENWAFEPQVLRMYAKHYQTGTAIPEELIAKIGQSSRFNQGFATTELLAASLSDMDIHTLTQYEPIDLEAFEHQALNIRRGLIPEIYPRYRYPYFAHIFDGGYAAGYYSYLWAEVLDKDAYEAFVEQGDIFDRATAASYRRNILERGGIEPGMDLYRKFRGHEPDIRPLMIKRGLVSAPPQETLSTPPLDTALRNASIERIIGPVQ